MKQWKQASNDEDVTFMAFLSDHSFHFVAGIPKEAIDGTDATVWIGSFVKGLSPATSLV